MLSKGKFRIAATTVLTVFVLAGLLSVPKYLVLAEQPAASDVIVVLLCSDYEARRKEAVHLLAEGYAKCIMIPLYREILTLKDLQTFRPDWPDDVKINKSAFPRYYENTHLELITAKEMMEASSFHSAIFVSSPYHMRRISMICKNVFGEKHRLFHYVPTRYEEQPVNYYQIKASDWITGISEIIKIGWFRIYSMDLNLPQAIHI